MTTNAAERWRGRVVLLTGASGFVGRHVMAQAMAGGVQVHTIGRAACDGAARSHVADITDREAVKRAVFLSQPEVVIHLAAAGVASGSCDAATMVGVNVGAIEVLLSACETLPKLPSMVLVGSGFEYSSQNRAIVETDTVIPSVGLYGSTKAAGSAIAGAFSERLPITLLRPFQLYGPGEPPQRIGPYIVERARAGKPIDVTLGEQLRDFLHVDDFAQSLWLAAAAQSACGFRIYNVGSGHAVTVRHYIEIVTAALATCGTVADVRFGARPYRGGEPRIYVADNRLIIYSLGWRPQIALEDGVREMVHSEMATCII